MDENHRDKTESKLTATEDKGSIPPEQEVGRPESKGTRKRANSLATFFKTWGTLIGTFIAVGTLLWGVISFPLQQKESAQMQATQLAESAQMQATQLAASAAQTLDQQRQANLDGYLQNMSDLLLKEHLRTNSDAQALAQALTFTTLRNLDGIRKGTLVKFLWQAGLINGLHPIISLYTADLRGADLIGELSGINLNHAFLGCIQQSGQKVCADLSGSRLCGPNEEGLKGCADLSGAHLGGTNLSGAILSCIDLGGGQRICADLSGANICENELNFEKACANLSGAYLQGSDLRGATLGCIDRGGGQRVCADLRGASLAGTKMNNKTDLTGTLLQGATYNSKPIRLTDEYGNPLFTVEPTQWPPGFNPKAASLGLVCLDC